MIVATSVLLVLVFAGAVFVTLLLTRWLLASTRVAEARVHDPSTPVLAHPVPAGVDAATLEAALAGAGFASSVEPGPPDELLVVECAPQDRERVRRIIEDVYAKEYERAGLHLGPAKFRDEA